MKGYSLIFINGFKLVFFNINSIIEIHSIIKSQMNLILIYQFTNPFDYYKILY
jgi:hypothetical protein